LGYVVLEIVDAHSKESIKLWDIEAGIAILKALGKKPEHIIFKENYLCLILLLSMIFLN